MDHTIANRYQLKSPIGEGGMGQVYAGIDTHTDQAVAIKLLKPDAVADDSDVIKRFEREGQILRQLNHPNIVAVFEVVESDDQPCIIMELVKGGSLADAIDKNGPLPLERSINIALELADALTRAHHLDIIHRDIKPQNVLIADDGTPRLSDFGLAHQANLPALTETHMIIGTLDYLSPEAVNGEPLDTRTDIWSFGVMLFEMLAGIRPFRAETTIATIKAILADPPTPDLELLRPDIPDSLAVLIYSMLEKDRSRRIDSMRRVAVYLEDIKNGKSPDVPTSLLERRQPPPQASRPRHNLPQSATPFIGREDEIENLISNLAQVDCRLVSLVGPGGMGKTRLAVEVAAQCIDDYEEGVFAVELAAVHAVEDIPSAIGRALQFQFSSDNRSSQEQIVDYLREKQMLLVLDNFEHLLDGVEIIDTILSNAPRIKILATSREVLNLEWEWVHTVRGMTVPDNSQALDLDNYSAIHLFTSRAKRVQPRFDLNANRACAIHICQLVDGMPLGIELAASWLRMLTCQELATEISQNLDVLTSRQRTGTERHRSLRAVFDYSWNLLSTIEQETLSKLSIFPAPFRREAARDVADAALAVLSTLVDKSLLRVDEAGWYDLHPLLQQYAAEKLAADPEIEQATHDHHSHYYLNFMAERAERIQGPESPQVIREIDAEVEHIKAAFHWACQQGDSLHLGPALLPLDVYLPRRREHDILDFCQPILAWKGPQDWVYVTLLAMIVEYSGTQNESLRVEERQRLFEVCRDLLTQMGDDPKLAHAYRHLFYPSLSFDRTAMRELIEQALRRFKILGLKWDIAICYMHQAHLALLEGKVEEAGHHREQALAFAHETGCPYIIADAHQERSVYLIQYGDVGAALEHAEQSREAYKTLGDEFGVALSDHIYSYILVSLGRFESARAGYEEALSVAKRAGNRLLASILHNDFGLMLIKTGEFDKARTHLEAAVTHQVEFSYLYGCSDSLGELELVVGNFKAAQNRFYTALTGAIKHGDTRSQVYYSNQFARLCSSIGQLERSAELLGFASNHPAAHSGLHERAEPLLEELRTKMDADVLEAAMERGKNRQLEEVVAELLADFAPDDL